MPIRSVYLTPGESRCDSGLTYADVVARNLVRECAIVAAAGPVVEKELTGGYDAECCAEDFAGIEQGLLPRISDEEAREKLREELPRLAEELIRRPRFLEAVRALAHELVQRPGMRKEIDGARAAAIIAAAMNGAQGRETEAEA